MEKLYSSKIYTESAHSNTELYWYKIASLFCDLNKTKEISKSLFGKDAFASFPKINGGIFAYIKKSIIFRWNQNNLPDFRRYELQDHLDQLTLLYLFGLSFNFVNPDYIHFNARRITPIEALQYYNVKNDIYLNLGTKEAISGLVMGSIYDDASRQTYKFFILGLRNLQTNKFDLATYHL